MSNQINLWPFLSAPTRAELIQLAITFNADKIYVWRKAYYEQRNLVIKEMYNQLKRETNMMNKEIYAKIAQESSQIFGTVTAKAVQHVIYDSLDSRHSSTIPELTIHHQ